MGVKLGSRAGRGRRAHSAMSDINVTPFVDVMLVLLVIFMITAPLLTAGVEVDLPKAKAKAVSQQDNAPLEIAIDNRGTVFMGETKVSLEKLGATLAAIAAEAPDRRVYIKADQKLDYGKIMNVMAIINTAGFTKIALVTDPTTASK